jgi:hypothetical protein
LGSRRRRIRGKDKKTKYKRKLATTNSKDRSSIKLNSEK